MTATMTRATDCPEPMKVFDQPSVLVQSSVMIDTTWRPDMTIDRVAKHSHTTIHGLPRLRGIEISWLLMAPPMTGAWVPRPIKLSDALDQFGWFCIASASA